MNFKFLKKPNCDKQFGFLQNERKTQMNIIKIDTDKFKTIQAEFYLTFKIEKKDLSKNALLLLVLKRGCKKYENQLIINKKLENMYGANLNMRNSKNWRLLYRSNLYKFNF